MTIQYWISGTSGDWSTAADWVPGVVPSSTDDAVISTTSNGMTVNGTAVANLLTLDASVLTLGGMLTLGTSLTVNDGAQFRLIGGTLSAQSISSNNNGSLSGYGTVSGAVSGQVDITATGGILKVQGSLAADQGHLYIGSGATLELSNTAPVGAPIYFQGSPATLKLDAPAAFAGTIEAIVAGDAIDLAGIAASSATYSGTTLTINETNGQQLIYNNVTGNVAGDAIAVASDNNGGTLVYWQISGGVVDNWISSSSGNWTRVADWSSGVPNSNSDAVISKTGSYTVTLSNADTAHSLSLNDTGAIVSDNTGGSLKLAGGSGTLAITNGIFQLAGGSLQAGTVSIGSGGTLQITKGTYTGSNALSETITDNGSLIDDTTATITGNISGTGTILAANKANLTITGSLTGSENFTLANSAHVFIANNVNGTGTFTIANSAVLEFGAADNENVTFASGSSGTVKFDQPLTQPSTTFAGTISGLTPKTKIDLADLTFVPGHMSKSYNNGVLTVSNGTDSVSVKLAGNFTNATWTLSKDATGGTLVVDPPAPTSTNNGPPGLDHVVALFNQFIAAGFPEQHGGQITTNALSQIMTNEQQFLANPHHG